MTHELWANLNAHIFDFPALGHAGRARRAAAEARCRGAAGPAAAGRAARARPPRPTWLKMNSPHGTDDRAPTASGWNRCDEDPDLSRLLRDDAGRPARRAEDDPVPHREFRQSRLALALVGLDRRKGGRRGARARRGARQLRSAGARLDVGRDGVDQPRAEGRRALLQGQGQAPRHGADRAQGHARHGARARARRLRGHVSRRAARRPPRSRSVREGAAAGHDHRVR